MKWAQFSVQQEETLYACRDSLMPKIYQGEPSVDWREYKSGCGHTVFWANRERQWESITNGGSMEIASYANSNWKYISKRWEPLRAKRTREVHSILDQLIDDTVSISLNNAVERMRVKRTASLFQRWKQMKHIRKTKIMRAFKAWKWDTNRDKKKHSSHAAYVRNSKRTVFHVWVMNHRSKAIKELRKSPCLGHYLCKTPICLSNQMPQFVFKPSDAAPKSVEKWKKQAHTAVRQHNGKVAELLLNAIPEDIRKKLKDKVVYSKTDFPVQWVVEALERCCHNTQKGDSLRIMSGAVESFFIQGVGDMGCINGAYPGSDVQEHYPHSSVLSCGHSVSWFHTYHGTCKKGCLVTKMPQEMESEYMLSAADDDCECYMICRNPHHCAGTGTFVTPLGKGSRAIASKTFMCCDGTRMLRFTKANGWAMGNNHCADISVYASNNVPEPRAWQVVYPTADKRTLVWDARWWRTSVIPSDFMCQLQCQISLKLQDITPCCKEVMTVFVSRNVLTNVCDAMLLFAYDNMGSISCANDDAQKHILCVDVCLMLLDILKDVLEFSVFDCKDDVQKYYEFCKSGHKRSMTMIVGATNKLREMGMLHVMESHLGALAKLMLGYVNFGQIFWAVWTRICDARGMSFSSSFQQCYEQLFTMSFIVRDGSCIGTLFPALQDDMMDLWQFQRDIVQIFDVVGKKAISINTRQHNVLSHAFAAKRFRTKESVGDFYKDVDRTKIAYGSMVMKWSSDGLVKTSVLNNSIRMRRRKRR